ncbi:winged helix-turn-helix domain-containing protein [Vibrio tapetis subsp. quintayensis]|uniref:winged helix-turn-helix domain-containing protein n=1 Tax=Vibrio tapetis TaxID=52443 RepID=UPI0025B4401A|nr:winged helix-turn-helix domain-containing protein [Vibrio tapetis]MDN3680308.1 winged helix-turn-helix domain-containing protein [Vibrio tapetis subsp. quintayensis]
MHYKFSQRYIFYPGKNTLVDCLENDNEVVIGVNESRLLLLLLRNNGQVVMRTQIKNFIWEKRGIHVDNSSLTQAVSNLRNVLGDSLHAPQYIIIVPKQGYRFISSVEAFISENTIIQNIFPVKTLTILEQCNAWVREVGGKGRIMGLILVTLLFPFGLFEMTQPAKMNFVVIGNIEGVLVKSPEGRLLRDNWIVPLDKCVSWYLGNHSDEPLPDEIIAISDIKHELILSYIYSAELSYRNLTMRLLTDKKDSYSLCGKEV